MLRGEKHAKRAAQQHRKQVMEDEGSGSDNDEFFDRTKKKTEFGINTKVETYDSLLTSMTLLGDKKDTLLKDLQDIQRESVALAEGEDSLDEFMNNNAKSILAEKQKVIQSAIDQLEKDGARIERLLKIAAPALKRTDVLPKPGTNKKDFNVMTACQLFTIEDDKKAKKTIKKEHLLCSEIPSAFLVNTSSEGDVNTNITGVEPTTLQEASIEPEQAPSTGENKPSKRERQRMKKKEKELEQQKRIKLEEYESKYEEWIPPTNQSGDGRTALNEKLGY